MAKCNSILVGEIGVDKYYSSFINLSFRLFWGKRWSRVLSIWFDLTQYGDTWSCRVWVADLNYTLGATGRLDGIWLLACTGHSDSWAGCEQNNSTTLAQSFDDYKCFRQSSLAFKTTAHRQWATSWLGPPIVHDSLSPVRLQNYKFPMLGI